MIDMLSGITQSILPSRPDAKIPEVDKSSSPFAVESKPEIVKAEPAVASLRDEIKEAGGFQKYANNIEIKKLEEMRAEILNNMGISEEELHDMSAEQRGNIESMIARIIAERMKALREVENKGKEPRDDSSIASLVARSDEFSSASSQGISNKEREKKAEPMLYSFFA